ncbi:DEAD-box ATP-dependent RNA helicase 41 [Acorus calamus]|uniref:DEAD-box ATP-dependent RNA helicase 41 n=1 Tax=Acorus calamus TaxID=4465 RepID=A0AAV9F1T6_ACOCL|nr:DEAD-box ATP-dependent RNA helicase 41 [Acorus calamus]
MGDESQSERSIANSDGVDSEADPVKEKCWQQREAEPGEPRCVVCGRYGEYICDETDDDVCSIECKQTLLNRLPKPKPVVPTVKLPAEDECFYVRDGHDSHSHRLTDTQIESLRRRIDIEVRGASVPPPIVAFASCELAQKLQQNLELAGYDIPTPVQMQAIPAALSGRDLLVSAATGTGKTASFLVPLIHRCASLRVGCPLKKPMAMVLSPTRELCVQVEDQAKALAKGLWFKTALVVGGDAMARQVYRINQGVELIIGTPGRLIDLLTKHDDIELDEVSVLVLDEVDCMLQRGFRDQVMQILCALSQPQILMFSAIVSQEVEKLASSISKDMVSISIGNSRRATEAVKQVVGHLGGLQTEEAETFRYIDERHFKPPVVVFVGSRLGADLLCEAIMIATGLKALSIHGEKPMEERRESLKLFLTGEVSVVVATGILGRVLDLVGVRQVIVFDMPNSIEEYIHQIGRASRMGEEGSAMLFVNEDDKRIFGELIGVLKSSGAAVPQELASSRYAVPVGRGPKRRKRGS